MFLWLARHFEGLSKLTLDIATWIHLTQLSSVTQNSLFTGKFVKTVWIVGLLHYCPYLTHLFLLCEASVLISSTTLMFKSIAHVRHLSHYWYYGIELCSNDVSIIIWLYAQIEPFHDTVVDAALGISLPFVRSRSPLHSLEIWRDLRTVVCVWVLSCCSILIFL